MTALATPDLKVWRHGDLPRPSWIEEHVASDTEANGTFMIQTPLGQARVHVGHAVVVRNGLAWTRPLGEVRAFLKELDDEESVAPAKPTRAPVAPRDEADVADRSDDTDDISRRIVAQEKPRFAVTPKAAPAAPGASSAALDRFRKLLPTRPPRVKPPLGRRPMIEWLALNEILIDDDYQRSVDARTSQKLIRQIAAEWDWRLCSPLMVSRREDGFYCIDGQHRLLGAVLRGDIDQLPAHVCDYGGKSEEAAMFKAVNHLRRSVNALDLHHAGIVAGDPDVMRVNTIVTAAGLKVGRNPGSATWVSGEVTFTTSLLATAKRHGDQLATEVLLAMAAAFPGQVLSVGSSVFTATCAIIITPPEGQPIDRRRLFRALSKYDMKTWSSFLVGCKGGDDRRRAMREALLMAYAETPAEVATC